MCWDGKRYDFRHVNIVVALRVSLSVTDIFSISGGAAVALQ